MKKTEIMVADRANQSRALAVSLPQGTSSEIPSLAASVRAPVWKGYFLILLFVVGFGFWAAYAPLAGGAIANGIVSPHSSRRIVQHLEGGIIRELKVRDGEAVRAGEPLIVLEPLQSRSNYETLLAQKQSLLARKSRLEAEKSGEADVVFPEELYADGILMPLAESQRQIFQMRLAAHEARRNVLKQRIEQLYQQIAGLTAQIESTNVQLSYIREEVDGKQKLLAQGLIPKPEALRLRRAESELIARRSEFETEIIKTKQQIAESNLQIASADAVYLEEIAMDLDKVNSELVELGERLRSSEDVLKRTTITAPVSGTVINMRFKTVGGVVQRGEPVLEIVPTDDSLVIEARVSPDDIRLIHPGQVAQIHLSAYSSRVMPRIGGVVLSASPDRVTDASGNQSYYLARIQVDREELKKRSGDITLIPGMSAEVIFVTERRTLLEYLTSPIVDVLRRGLRET